MKKALAVALTAAMLLNVSAMSISAAGFAEGNVPYSMSRNIGSAQLAPASDISELNGLISGALSMNPNNFVKVDYISVERILRITVNTNPSVSGTNYLAGLKGTGFKTSLNNFLQVLSKERNLEAYTIDTLTKESLSGDVAQQIQDDFTSVMQDKLVTVTGSKWAPYFATMGDLAKVGAIPAKIYFSGSGTQYYINYTVEFVAGNW